MIATRVINPAAGPYAVRSCSRLTVSYWDDREEAERTARHLDKTGCGSRCHGVHRVTERDPRGWDTAPGTCALVGCRRAKHARGWCKRHYMRWWHGWRRRHRLGPLPPRPSHAAIEAEMRASYDECARVVGA